MNDYKQKLEISIRAAVSAGNILKKHSEDTLHLTRVKKESFRDITTEADIYAEENIVKILREADQSPIISEEAGIIGVLDEKKGYWVVDPLDGTVNYANHIPFCAVSIAYMENMVPVVGVIYNPFTNELFYGARGLGVYKNHRRISIVDRSPEEALFAVTFSGKKHDTDRDKEFKVFSEVNDRTMGCLRTGAAALNLAYVAEGRMGGCFGRLSRIWDIAAGILLAELAGAVVTLEVDKKDHSLATYSVLVPKSQHFLEDILALIYGKEK